MRRIAPFRGPAAAVLLAAALGLGARTSSPAEEKPAARADPALIAKLIRQLGSPNFKTRAYASRQLAGLDEVPQALREAAGGADAEVARRAQAAIAAITARLEERELQAMVRDLHKVELDRLVRRMVTNERFAGDRPWQAIQAAAKAATAEANRLGGRKYPVPDFTVRRMARLLLNGATKNLVDVSGSVVLSTGPTPYITSVTHSLIIIDGDFTGATGIDNSLLIVRGNVGRVTSVRGSIILATGNWVGATTCDDSFVQVNNQRIRFTGSRDSVLLKTLVKTTGPTSSRVLNADKGPLHLLKFIPRKADAELAWGKPVNGLAVAVTPADRKGHFLLRWKNVGKETFELPWVRLNSDLLGRNRDDLLGHVFLAGPGGKLVPARKYPAPPAGGPPLLDRTVVLGPGQAHEETIELGAYVAGPAAAAPYQLWIELNIPGGRRGWEWEVRTWSGTVRSNVLDVRLGK